MEMQDAVNRGWGERDARVYMLLQQERAGLHIAVDRNKVQTVLDAD